MKKLTEIKTISSLEVAEMLGIRHGEILRKLEGNNSRKGYIEILNEHQMALVDYFIKSSYKDNKGEERPCYEFTKLGCDFIANKFTGEKGILFTAKYVKRFNDMEHYIKEHIDTSKSLSTTDEKSKLTEAKLINAKVRMSNQLLKLSCVDTLSTEYKNILVSKATEVLTGEQLIPLPKSKQKTYSATEIGKMFGVSKQKIGLLSNKFNLKTEQYGEWYRSKSEYSTKEVDTWVYYDSVIPVFKELLDVNVEVGAFA